MSNIDAEQTPRRRFRLRHTLAAAYRSVLDQFDCLVALSWRWLVAVWPLGLAYAWLTQPSERARAMATEDAVPQLEWADTYWLIWSVVTLVPLSAIAVKWHRHLLIGEQARGDLRIDGPIVPYAVMAFALSAMVLAPMSVMTLLTPDADDPLPTASLVALALGLVALILWGRFAVALPGIALGDPGGTLGAAWRMTRGATFKLFLGSMLCAVPLFAVGLLIHGLTSAIESRAAYAAIVGTLEIVNLLLITIGVSFLSFAWLHFFGSPEVQGD